MTEEHDLYLRAVELERDDWHERAVKRQLEINRCVEQIADLSRRVSVAKENLEMAEAHAFGTFFEGVIHRALRALRGDFPT